MVRKLRQQGFLTRWVVPLIVGFALTAAALLWLWEGADHGDLASVRPTMLDFGRPPSLPVPPKVLTAEPPPPLETAAHPSTAEAQLPDLPAAPAPDSFEVLFSRVTVLDAVRFRTIRDRETLVIHLAGINGVAFSDACEGTAGRWNCGARARADLARLIGPRAIGCIGITAKGDDGEVQANCWVGGRNLSVFMVSRGWAEPVDPTDPLLAPYAQKARAEKLGRFGDGGLQPPDLAGQ